MSAVYTPIATVLTLLNDYPSPPFGSSGTNTTTQPQSTSLVLNSIYGDLIATPFRDGLVYCRQYWPGAAALGGRGGFFVAVSGTDLVVDNVVVFAGSNCRWVRIDREMVLADHAGCIGTKPTDYRLDVNPQSQFAPMPLLSDKFATLAAAQAWYPGARINNAAKIERAETAAQAFATSLNNAAIQHALTIAPINASGVYRFNRPIEYFSNMVLRGAGGSTSRTVFIFDADNAFIPRRSSALAATNPTDEVYKRGIHISGLRAIGTVPVANNSDQQDNVLSTAGYDRRKSGFFLDYRDPTPGSDEATDLHPLMLESSIEDVCLDRWYGSGWSVMNEFNCRFHSINCNNNKGFGVHTFLGNSSILADCYVGRSNSSGGYWYQNGGYSENNNGVDHFDNVRPAVVIGDPADNSYRVSCKLSRGNIEGGGKWSIRVYGAYSSVYFDKTYIQWWSNSASNEPIRLYGFGCRIYIDVDNFFACGPSPDKTIPTNIILARGNQTQITASASFTAPDKPVYTYKVVDDDAGASDLYPGIPQTIKALAQDGYNNAIGYGLQIARQRPTDFDRLFVDGQEIGTVDTTAALPTISAPPGLYINSNPAATRSNKLFAKTGTDATGWLAI